MGTAIVGGTIIDGLGDPIPRGAVVIGENGKIAAVGPEASVGIPRDAKLFERSWAHYSSRIHRLPCAWYLPRP